MRRTPTSSMRRRLALRAIRAATTIRQTAGLGQDSPICIYDLCHSLGITVRFIDVNMEGMYQRGSPPRIHLSALRPIVRRSFTCAHELGHHTFGHGSSLAELCSHAGLYGSVSPRELLADLFAASVLMPTVAVRRAFTVRGWSPETATPVQMYVVASSFGVGYVTLLVHLSAGLGLISRARSATLRRTRLPALRQAILGRATQSPLIIVDHHRTAPVFDMEVPALLLLPPGTETSGDSLSHEADLSAGRLFRAARPGITQVFGATGNWSAFARVARHGYVGLAEYRHLEDA